MENGETLYIAKEYENNLNKRNCQLGYVEGIPTDNPLKLEYGDLVYVNHMVFFGEIAEHSKGYTVQPHVIVEGEKLFRVQIKDVYCKLKKRAILSLGDIILVDGIMDENKTDTGIFKPDTAIDFKKDIGIVRQAKNCFKSNDTILVERHALYPIEINKEKLFRVREREIMATIDGESVIPCNDRIVVKDLEEVEVPNPLGLDLSLMKQERDCKSEVWAVGENIMGIEVGDIVYRRKSGGMKYKDVVVITVQGQLDDESVHGKIV